MKNWIQVRLVWFLYYSKLYAKGEETLNIANARQTMIKLV